MDFNYTDTQDMLRDTLARFLADTYDFESRKKMIASAAGRDPGIWRALATELGILSAPFSEEQGGLGGGADMQYTFNAKVSDPVAYRAEVVGMVKVAQRDMLTLVKR